LPLNIINQKGTLHYMNTSKALLCVSIICLMLLAPDSFAQKRAQASAGPPARKTIVDVPMLFNGPMPAVEVMVNGKGPFLFTIDTGARGQARADQTLAARLGLQPSGKALAGDGSGINTREVDIVKLDSIAFGGVQFHNVEAIMRDYNRMSPPNAPHIDGILGFNLFTDYLLTLDYVGKRVRLEQGELPKADGREILNFQSADGTPTVELQVGALKVNANIDSGNMRSELTLPSAMIEKLSLAAPPKVVGRARTTSNEFEIKEAALNDSLHLGGYEIAGPTIIFADIFKDANIGSRLLKNFVLTFDQKNHRVRLIRQNSTPANP
jgi:hypothetical protein